MIQESYCRKVGIGQQAQSKCNKLVFGVFTQGCGTSCKKIADVFCLIWDEYERLFCQLIPLLCLILPYHKCGPTMLDLQSPTF